MCFFCEEVKFLNNAVANWKTTHNNAICHKLFNTAHPNACRKLDWPVANIFIVFSDHLIRLVFFQAHRGWLYARQGLV